MGLAKIWGARLDVGQVRAAPCATRRETTKKSSAPLSGSNAVTNSE